VISIKFRFSLLTQIILLISIVVLISMFLVSTLYSILVNDLLDNYYGQQAMTVAKLTASDDDIVAAFAAKNPTEILQPMAEAIRKSTGASYVVIGNREGIRLTHPNPENIGSEMGSSNDPVFNEHQSIIYRGVGISGPAIKAKTPIYNNKGQVIGVSSVGYFLDDIQSKREEYHVKVLAISLILLVIGISGAYFIARRVKRLFFGLEPEEISFVFKEKEATLESISDGIIAIDTNLKIITMNKKARELLGKQQYEFEEQIKHPHLTELVKKAILTGQGHTNQHILFGNRDYVIDFSPIMQDSTVKGVVLTLRLVSEIDQLVNEVSKIKVFSENMRAQNHEFLNKLNTIYGLLCLEQYDKAMEVISGEVRERQDVIAFVMSSVKDPMMGACLLGKINRAKELKVHLEIDLESNMEAPSIDTANLVTIVGNVIDNAMEAAIEKNGSDAKVKVSFTDIGQDIIFDIEDNGPGIKEEQEDLIFQEGYSTKNSENHGIGLALVKNTLALLQGEIYIDTSSLGGARFSIVIPKGKGG
jgi:two-component system, CitB family, sensor kinase